LDKKRVILFGMTGFGNNALRVLSAMENLELIAVFTPKRSKDPFPYYPCVPLEDEVSKRSDILLLEDAALGALSTVDLLEHLSPHLIVVSTYNQIIPARVISIPMLGVVNLHPSLLPKYRGATPTAWVLVNGEEVTGVTAHFIEDERIDSGRIIFQSSLKIHKTDTDGSLRRRLAVHSESVLTHAIRLILRTNREWFACQDESEASYYRKRTINDAEINLRQPFIKIRNQIRASTPYPGAYLTHEHITYLVSGVSLVDREVRQKSGKGRQDKLCLDTAGGIATFIVKEKVRDGEKNGSSAA
jgi:methionyl-tRNA formyltransferase